MSAQLVKEGSVAWLAAQRLTEEGPRAMGEALVQHHRKDVEALAAKSGPATQL